MTRWVGQANKYWRVLGTGFSFVLFGVGAFVFAIVLALLLYPIPISRLKKQRFTRKAVSVVAQLYLRVMSLLGLLSYSFEGAHLLKHGGQLVIANHPTLLDAIFLFSMLPNANCIVKAAIAYGPITIGLVRLAGYIPNSENSEYLLDRAATAIREGQTLIVFPEGTRSDDIHEIRFKRGAAHVAIKAGCPIQPVMIQCQPLTLRKKQPWYQVPNSPPHFTVSVLERVVIHESIDTSKPESIQARRLTEHWHDIYAHELQPNV